MIPRSARAALAATTLAVAFGVAAPAHATPVCTDDTPKALCGGRTVPEPETTSLTYLTFNEFQAALEDLAGEFPGMLSFGSIGTSVNGHDLLVAEVSDPDSPVPLEDRKVVYVAQSIHGNEAGGREGMIRVIEDLLRATDAETEALLERVRLVQFVPNSDGWVRGDWDRVGSLTFTRGNGNGVDLNRQFPWKGWIPDTRVPLTEPEARAVVDDLRARLGRGEQIVASADVHGMLQDQAAVWSMLSSGEFDLAQTLRQRMHGAAVEDAVETRLSPRALFVLGQAAGDRVIPHVLTSSSEFKGGLSGSGFLGDWIAQKDGGGSASLSTIELFFNQPPQSFAYAKEMVQVHVESVRAIVRALMEQALVEPEVSVDLPGEVGYLVDPLEVDGASPMELFRELDPFLDEPLRAIELADFQEGSDPLGSDPLAGLSALVVTSDLAISDSAIVDRLRAFVEDGGNLVLTDAGLRLLAAIDPAVADAEVTKANTRISNASFVDLGHPMAEGVRDNALHLYEPATLGYNSETVDESPVWRVARSTFDARGETVATTGGQTSVGALPFGEGSVHVIGGLLPPPTTRNKVLFGLNDYAPADTGHLLLLNALGADLLVDDEPARLDETAGVVAPAAVAGR